MPGGVVIAVVPREAARLGGRLGASAVPPAQHAALPSPVQRAAVPGAAARPAPPSRAAVPWPAGRPCRAVGTRESPPSGCVKWIDRKGGTACERAEGKGDLRLCPDGLAE